MAFNIHCLCPALDIPLTQAGDCSTETHSPNPGPPLPGQDADSLCPWQKSGENRSWEATRACKKRRGSVTGCLRIQFPFLSSALQYGCNITTQRMPSDGNYFVIAVTAIQT